MNILKHLWIVLFSVLSINVLGNEIHKQVQANFKKSKPVEYSVFKEKTNRLNKSGLKKHKLMSIDKVKFDKLFKTKPKNLILNVPGINNSLKLELTKVEIFTSDFKVSTSSGKNIEFKEGIFYRGVIRGDTNSIVTVSISADEISGIISSSTSNYDLGKVEGSADYIINETAEIPTPFDCSSSDVQRVQPENTPQNLLQTDCRTLRVYIECDFDLYTKRGSSVTNVTTFVTGLFSQVATVYANEGIPIQLSEIFIWTTQDPFVSQTTATSVLTSFRQTRTTFNGDLAHLISTRPANQGGVAYLDVLCSSGFRYAYSNIYNSYQTAPAYSWSVMVFCHEMGHNMGSPHTQSCTWLGGALDNCYTTEGGCPPGPAPINGGTIMSYCHLTANGINLSNGFGQQPGDRIRSRFLNASCLSGSSSVSISPASASICPGSNITLTASGGSTYTWTPQTGLNTTSGSSVVANPQTTTTYTVTSIVGSCSTSTSRTVIVLPQFNSGTLVSSNQTFSSSGDPSIIQFSTFPTGSNGTYTYQWYSKSGANSQPVGNSTSGWTLIPGATSSSYDPPVQNSTISFAVQVDPTGSPDCAFATWSNGIRIITINNSGFNSGILSSGNQWFCFGGGDPSLITFSTSASAGSSSTTQNLITSPEQISTPYWTFDKLLVAQNVSNSPDGLQNAEFVSENTATGSHRFFSPIINTTGQITSSIWVKPNGRTCVGLYVGNFNTMAITKFQLTGVGSILSNNSNVISSAITQEPNGWYRISVKSNGDANYRFRIYLQNSSCQESYVDDGVYGISCRGAKVETGNISPYFGSGSLTYQWYSQNGIISQPSGDITTGWTLIQGANSSQYDPGTITQSTTFACLVSSGLNSSWSQGVRQVSVLPQFNPGIVSSGDQTFCGSGNPSNITLSQSPVGSGAFQWRWYFKESSSATCPVGSSTSGWSTNNTSVNISGNTTSGAVVQFDPSSAGTLNNGRTFAVLITPISNGNIPACGVPSFAQSCRKTYVVSCSSIPVDTTCLDWHLGEPRPNPSQSICSIDVNVPDGRSAKLVIFDNQGLKIDEIELYQMYQTLTLDVSNWKSGLYYYTLFGSDGEKLSQKMVVVK